MSQEESYRDRKPRRKPTDRALLRAWHDGYMAGLTKAQMAVIEQMEYHEGVMVKDGVRKP